VPEHEDYIQLLTQPLTPKEFGKINCSKEKGVPCGSDKYIRDSHD
jgi:hypothetical protein